MSQTYAEGEINENGDVMGPNGHFLTKCKDCPETDDHPKLHYGQDTYHFDCLPAFAEQDVTRFLDHPQHAAARRIIDAARGGVHGQELRQHIDDDHAATTVPALETFHAALAAAAGGES